MKKKILSIALVVCIAITAIAGATLAYLQDADYDKNVMVAGNVKIHQNEQQRTLGDEVDGNAQHQYITETDDGLEDFEDDHKILPYTGKVDTNGMANEWGDPVTTSNGTEYNMFNQNKNAIDKIVSVTNIGTEDCYVRTLFAWEMIEVTDDNGNVEYKIPINVNFEVGNGDPANTRYIYCTAAKGANGYGMPICSKDGAARVIDIDGVKYCVAEYIYNDYLEPRETTEPSLRNFYLNAYAGNEWFDMVGEDGKYNILVLSQAVQTAGFMSEPGVFDADEAINALNTAFGAVDESYTEATLVSDETLVEWFANCQ